MNYQVFRWFDFYIKIDYSSAVNIHVFDGCNCHKGIYLII